MPFGYSATGVSYAANAPGVCPVSAGVVGLWLSAGPLVGYPADAQVVLIDVVVATSYYIVLGFITFDLPMAVLLYRVVIHQQSAQVVPWLCH